MTSASPLCPEQTLARLAALAGTDPAQGGRDLDSLLREYPEDPRLHFLKGSLRAAAGDYETAQASMRRAVDLAPGYAIARFQLGFLLLTSGQPGPAQSVWEPLRLLPADNYLRLSFEGLDHLIHDRFDAAIHGLRAAISRNQENPAMNRDMQMIIDAVLAGPGHDDTPSSVGFLLRQSSLKATRH